ncbi:divergent polysaccharide deacetylase family protein [Myxococcota bacterium]|nr:divergent polysaccharide deacetylase family protein [Myxococcota bacterium]
MSRTAQVLFALVFGGLVSVAADRVFLRPAPAPPRPAPLAEKIDPAPARSWLTGALNELAVSGLEYGTYPLRGAGRALDETLPLLSFSCPPTQPCPALLDALRVGAERRGFYFAEPKSGDREGGPRHRALSQGPRPALALRAFDPGPRLTVVISGPRRADLDALLALDRHVTIALDPRAEAALDVAARLDEMGRELILQLSMSSPAMRDPAQIDAQIRHALDALPQAVGLAPLDGEAALASREHTAPLLGALKARGAFFLNPRLSPADVANATALTMGVRRAEVTHRLGEGDLAPQLRAVEAALVLEGRALVLAPASGPLLEALAPWLSRLKSKKSSS